MASWICSEAGSSGPVRLGAQDRAHEYRTLPDRIGVGRRHASMLFVVKRLRSSPGTTDTFEFDGGRRPAGHPTGDIHEVLCARERIGGKGERAPEVAIRSDIQKQLPFPKADLVEVIGRFLPVEKTAISVVSGQIMVIRSSPPRFCVVGSPRPATKSCVFSVVTARTTAELTRLPPIIYLTQV